jgi:hypothetical protein
MTRNTNYGAASRFTEGGEKGMTQRKKTTIKQGAVTDVMSHLADLPERGKDPCEVIGLPEIFRAKEYLDEIKGALKKGYTFDDLAAIFTEKCGVDISARQMKYHYTREKNKKAKSGIGKKSKMPGVPKGTLSPENLSRTGPRGEAEGNIGAAGAGANVPAIHIAKPAALVSATDEICSEETGAFLYEKRV